MGNPLPLASGGDELNSLGLYILGFLDYRIVTIVTLCAYLLCGIVAFFRKKPWPDMESSFSVILALLTLFSGISIFCVFDLTNPPAINLLSGETRGIIGTICAPSLIFLTVKIIRSIL